MASNTVTIALSGEHIPLREFSEAIVRFRALIDALSSEVATGVSIEWLVDDLEIGSALATARGQTANLARQGEVEKVVRAYGSVGTALERGTEVPFSDRVKRELFELTSILNGKVEAIRFETAETESIVRSPHALDMKASTAIGLPAYMETTVYGAVEGRIQTLSNRGSLRFTLYDTHNDKAVSCYIAEGQDDLLRDVWGRRALVEGRIRRDPLTGRPLTIRDVRHIQPLPEPEPYRFYEARGILPLMPGEEMPEDRIRRLRDA